jgi:hypothetical protein
MNNYLETLVQDHDSLVQFLLHDHVRISGVVHLLSQITYDVGDDTRQQLALLVFMWALLDAVRECPVYLHAVLSITILGCALSNECW